ncbi:FkbM family methyltransferase [Ruegeria arenilitoris]|uniref:FkbM family methyltransferase n=1 Tax=Ruegeria arenilitoris TaxID=1173585 RepID=UPI00147E2F7E|nr:FkbM family methyltransferase [Ruegeria arenilitoris]
MSDNKKSGLSRAARSVREAGRVLRGKKKHTKPTYIDQQSKDKTSAENQLPAADQGVTKPTYIDQLSKDKTSAENQFPAADQGVIVDIGMNDGKDTVYYRKRGFEVIAVEAIPDLCAAMSDYFSDLEVNGVDIRNFAVTDDGKDEVTFYVNKYNTAWSSVKEEYGSRKDGAEKIVVPTIDLSQALQPVSKQILYVKIDIEGLDKVALKQVMALPDLPSYVSVENGSLSMLNTLHENGYDRFKFSNQKYVEYQIIAPSSPHGHIPVHTFKSSASGVFGEDLPGAWIQYEDAVKIQKALKEARRTAPDNLFSMAIGWFDLHAKHSSAK